MDIVLKVRTLEDMKKTGGRGWPPVSSVLAMFSGLVLESAVWGLSLYPYL